MPRNKAAAIQFSERPQHAAQTSFPVTQMTQEAS